MRCVTICVLMFCTIASWCQNDVTRCFQIGENQDQFLLLAQNHPSTLLDVYDNSMTNSYKAFTDVMKSLEKYADNKGLDLKGLKLWVNVYWDKSGEITHITYYPKPNSKNLDYKQVTKLFDEFIADAPLSKTYHENYIHNGSIAFPVFNYGNLAKEK